MERAVPYGGYACRNIYRYQVFVERERTRFNVRQRRRQNERSFQVAMVERIIVDVFYVIPPERYRGQVLRPEKGVRLYSG